MCKHNLQLGCLDPEFRCLDTSAAWYVSNLQVDEGSSDDQAGEVNTHHYILQCYFVQKPKNVIYFLSKHSCQGTYLLGDWQKPRAERMRSHSKVTLHFSNTQWQIILRSALSALVCELGERRFLLYKQYLSSASALTERLDSFRPGMGRQGFLLTENEAFPSVACCPGL